MLQLNQLTKTLFGNSLFKEATAQINDGKKVALIGDNGTGKSTMLQLIVGNESIDKGSVAISKGQKISLLEQASIISTDETVYDFIYNGQRELKRIHHLLVELEYQLSDSQTKNLDQVIERYGRVQEEFMAKNGYIIEEAIQSIATGLGIQEMLEKPMTSLSGGQQTLAKLARCLLEDNKILLLDEPTNHLDTKGLNWLENYIKHSQQTMVIVSHDRYFLDQVVEEVLLIENKELRHYTGNYSTFKKLREEELLIQQKDFLNQQKEIKQTEEAIRRFRHWGAISDNENHFKKAKRLEKQLETMDKVVTVKKKELNQSQIFQESNRSGKEVLKLNNVGHQFNENLVFSNIDASIYWQDKVAITGKNGSGKSTLLRLILEENQPTIGEIIVGESVKIGYLPQVITYKKPKETVLDYFRGHVNLVEEEGRRVLAHFHFFKEDVFKAVGNLSGGEKVRLELACLMSQPINCLILDEPTNHLDISTREWLETIINQFSGTLIMISHDRYFVEKLATKQLKL